MTDQMLIGKPVRVPDEDEPNGRLTVEYTVDPAAPDSEWYREGFANLRDRGANSWEDFFQKAGLSAWFLSEIEPHLNEMPFVIPVKREWAKIISAAAQAYFDQTADPAHKSLETQVEEKECLLGLIWMRFWIDWALQNAAEPSLYLG